MANDLQALAAAAAAGEPLDTAALDRLDAASTDGLAGTLRVLHAVVGRATNIATLDSARTWLIDRLHGLLETESKEARRGRIRQRLGDLLASAGDTDGAVLQWMEAFGDLPDEQILARLVGLLGTDGDPAIERAVLETRLALADEGDPRASIATTLGARLLAAGALPEALAAFRVLLENRPGDPRAVEAIGSIEQSLAAQRELREALLAEVAAATDPAGKARAWLDLADALFEADPLSAEGLEALQSAFDAHPGDPEVSARVLAGALRTGDMEAVAQIGRAWVENADPGTRFEAARTAGLSLVASAPHRDAAIAMLRQAAALRPGDMAVVTALADALEADGHYDEARTVVAEAQIHVKSRDEKRDLLLREGLSLWHHGDDMEAAEKVFRRIRAQEPRNRTALDFYEDYLTRHGEWRKLHAVLSQKFGLVPPDERFEVAAAIARVAEDHLENPDKGVEAYKRVLAQTPDDERAASKLMELYRKTGKWHALIEFLNQQIRQLGSDHPERMVALLFEIIEIYQDPEKLPVEEMVIHTYNRIVEASPTNLRALDNLAQRYEDASRWSDLVDILQKKIDATTDEETLLDLFHQVVDLYISKMSSTSQAIPFLERILEFDPQNLDVVRKLRDIYKAKHNLVRLYDTYLAELKLLHGKGRIPVLTELAMLATEKLHRPQEAIAHWAALLELSPRSERAADALLGLYSESGQWADFAELLEGRMELARTRRKRLDILERLARVQLEQLQQPDAAEATYQRILEASPQHSEASEALRQLYVGQQRWDDLKALYAAGEDWAGYIQLLDDSLARAAGPEAWLEIQREVVRVYEERLSAPEKAVERLEAVIAEHPDEIAVARQLEERYGRLGRTDGQIRTLWQIAGLAKQDEAVEALQKGAELLSAAGRHAEAFDWVRRLCTWHLDDGRLQEDDRLQAAAEESGRWDDAADWYREAAERAPDPADQRRALEQLAQILRRHLDRTQDAIQVVEAISRVAPDDPGVLDELCELTRTVRDWEGFRRSLERRVDFHEARAADGDVERMRSDLLSLGELFEDILDDPDRAVACFRRVMAAFPADEEACAGLDRIYSLDERWADLCQLLDDRIAQLPAEGAIPLHARAARILQDRMFDVAGAIDRLERAVALGPAPEAVAHLQELFDAEIQRARVGAILDPVLRQSGDFRWLVRVLSDQLARAEELSERLVLLADIADVRESRLDDPGGALALTAQRVALDPGDASARTALERLAGKLGFWAAVTGLYGRILGHPEAEAPFGLAEVHPLRDPVAEESLTRRLADIWEAEIQDFAMATTVYERALAFDPEDPDVLDALERLHRAREDWEALLAVLQRKVELSWEAAEKRTIYLEICAVLRDRLDRAEDAIPYFVLVLDLGEAPPGVADELEGLYRAFGRWEELAALLVRRIRATDGLEDRGTLRHRLVAVLRDQLEDLPGAIAELTAILAADPDDMAAVDALEAVLLADEHPDHAAVAGQVAGVLGPWFAERGLWQREVGVLRVRARLSADPLERSRLLLEAGSRYEADGSALSEALACYAEAFKLNPQATEASEALERTAGAMGAWSNLAAALEGAVQGDDASLTVRLLLRVGALARYRLNDADRAMDVYERVLGADREQDEALRALDELYANAGRETDRVVILERRAQLAASEAERRALMFEAALLHDELGDVDAALDAFQYVAQHGDAAQEPIARVALDHLQRIYEAHEEWPRAVDVLTAKAETAASAEDRKAFLMAAAETLEARMGVPGQAIEVLQRVHEVDRDDVRVIEELRRLYDDTRRWDDLEELLLEARARATQDEDANRHDFVLGQLYEHRLDRPGDALDRYEAIIERTPGFLASVRSISGLLDDATHGLRASTALLGAFEANEDWESLARVLLRRLEQWPDAIDVVGTYLRLGDLFERHFGDPGRAFDSLCHASLYRWDDRPELRATLVRLAAETGRWDDLEVVDRDVLGRMEAGGDRVRLLLEMARVARDVRDDAERAEGLLLEVLEVEPGHAGALAALEAAYEAAGQTERLVDILRLREEYAASDEERVALLRRIADLQTERLDRAEEAVITLERLITVDATDRTAYERIAALHAEQGDWESAVTALERELDHVPDHAEQVALRRRIAGTLYDHVGDRERAVAEGTRLLDTSPDDAEALRILEGCLQERYAYDQVLNVLIPVYERAEAWERLQHLYRAHADEADEDGRLWALDRLRTLQSGPLAEPWAAFRTLQEMARIRPTDRTIQAEVEDAAGALGAEAELAELYEALLDGVTDPADAIALALHTADYQDSAVGSREGAARLYRRALELDAESELAMTALSVLYEDLGDPESLAGLKVHAASVASTADERTALLLEAAAIRAQRLEDLAGAIELLREVLALDPHSRDGLAALEDLLARTGRWDEQEELYRRWLDVATAQETVRVRHRLATCLLERHENTAGAIHELARVLEAEPGHLDARELLQSLVSGGPPEDAEGRQLRSRAADILERVYDQSTPWALWRSVFAAQLAVADAVPRRVALLRRLGALELANDEPDAAFEHLGAAFVDDHDDPELLDTLEVLARDAHRLDDLVVLTGAALEHAPDVENEVWLLARTCGWLTLDLGRAQEAVPLLERLIALRPERVEALVALSDIYEASGQPNDLGRVLRLRLAAAEDAEKPALLLRLGTLAQESGDSREEAIDFLARIPEGAAEREEALTRLDGLYEQAADWSELVSVRRAQLARASDDDERIRLLLAIAKVEERDLARPTDAIATYREALNISPQNIYGLARLEHLHAEVGDAQGLLGVLEEKRELYRDPRERVEIDLHRGRLKHEELGDPEGALQCYRLVLAADPQNAEVLPLLEAIADAPGVQMQVCILLESLYQRNGEHANVAALLERQLGMTDDPAERADILRRLAEIRDETLDDPAGAIAALGSALALEPGAVDLREQLREIAERSGQWEALASAYADAVASVTDVDGIRDLHGRLAEIHEERLDDPAGAIEHLQYVLRFDEFGVRTLASLARLLEVEGRWQELVDVNRRRLALSPPEEAAALERALARILLDELGDEDAALHSYTEILWKHPDDPEVLAGLTRIADRRADLRVGVLELLRPFHQGAGRWAELAALLERCADDEEPSAASRRYKEIADLYLTRLAAPPRAFDYLRRAVEADPGNSAAFRELKRLAAQQDRAPELADIYDELLAGDNPAARRRDLLLEAARLARDVLDEPAAAEERFEQVLAIEPEHLEALTALEHLYEAQGKLAELIHVCEVKALLPIDASERVGLYRKVALAAAEQRTPGKAEEAWTALLEFDGTDRQALESLEAIYRDAQDWQHLIGALERQAELTEEPTARAALRVEAGQLLMEHCGDERGAVDAFEEALELDPGAHLAIDSLLDLYGRIEDWGALADVMERKAAVTQDDPTRLETLLRLAELEGRHLGRTDAAIAHYSQVLAIQPDHEVAMDALIRIYHRFERWEALCELYERKVEMTGAAAEQVALLSKAAEIYEERLGLADKALKTAARVLALVPDEVRALRLKARLESRGKSPEAAVSAYEALLPRLGAGPERVQTLVALGALHLDPLGNTAKALECLREALREDPEHAEANGLLKAVLYKRESWEALVPVLEREHRRAADRAAVADVAHELAQIYRDRLGDPDKAVQWLEAGYNARRDHRGIVEDLIAHHTGREAWGEVAPLLEWLVNYLEAKRLYSDLAVQAHRLGALFERLQNPDKALGYYELASRSESGNVATLLALGRLYLERGKENKALQTLQGCLVLQHSIAEDDTRAHLFRLLAQACIAAGEPIKAKRHLKRLLAIRPSDAEAAALLGKLS